MPDSNERPLIFSTRTLPPHLATKMDDAGIEFVQQDFINVEHKFDERSFLNRLESTASQARVFTSKNSVYSLEKLAEKHQLNLPPKKTFTVGIKATEMLEKFGLKSVARANNAISLAQIIARNPDVQAVDFFCGNKSLDDLPEYLESKGVRVNKEIVYETELVQEKVDTSKFDGLIFLSPTAVYSFFKKNSLDPSVPAFCIGATTSEAIHLRCDNKRIESDDPSIESVVDKVIEHFGKRELKV